MAQRATDFREKILKEGPMKHRQTSLSLPRWRPRYVVFKITSSGRLRFIIYKEQPTSPSNEIKEVQIEEFGGLEVGLKLDSEKHAFALISTGITDCFSTDAAEEMFEWCRLLREYLGKELVLNVSIPYKQNILKSGKAHLRIRNTGFTITTCDNPPRCMGTWQIIHIRKFGGTDAFRFQTGSKCVTGEFLYTLNTEDNGRVKSLFNDLSQHKPIFADDRLGRRMTVDRRTRSPETPMPSTGHHRVDNRYSLQNQTREYENRQTINDTFRHNSADPIGISPPMGRRHSSVDGQSSAPNHLGLEQISTNGASRSIEDLTNRNYQNIVHPHGSGRRSPQKKCLSEAIPEQVPDGYYNVSPPLVLKKKMSQSSSVSSPPPSGYLSSPDEEEAMQLPRVSSTHRRTPPMCEDGEALDGEYIKLAPGSTRVMTIEGDNMVVSRERERKVNGHTPSPPFSAPALYQNLEFMKPSSTNGAGGDEGERERIPSVSDSMSTPPMSQRISSTDTPPAVDWSPHALYTNVELAFESAQGAHGTGRSVKASGPRRNHLAYGGEGTPFTRVQSRDRDKKDHSSTASMPPSDHAHSAHKYATPLSPVKRLNAAQSSRLRQSQSNFELRADKGGRESKTERCRPSSPPTDDYYNHFVLGLPAHSPRSSQSLATTQVQAQTQRLSRQLSPSGRANDEAQSPPNSPPTMDEVNSRVPLPVSNGYTRLVHRDKASPTPSRPAYTSVDDAGHAVTMETHEGGKAKEETDSNLEVERPSYYDRLEIRPGSRSPCFSPVPSAGNSRVNSPRPGCYDTLAPISTQPPRQNYDTLARTDDSKSSSPSPEPPIDDRALQYKKKVEFIGHEHMYESVVISKVTVEEVGKGTSGDQAVDSGKELPSEWLSPPPGETKSFDQFGKPGNKASSLRLSRKTTLTDSRRKQLPLQSVDVEDFDKGEGVDGPSLEHSLEAGLSSTGATSADGREARSTPPLPQKRSRGSPKPTRKTANVPRKDRTSSELSTDSDLLSSLDSRDSDKRESTLSVESTSSADAVEMERSNSLQIEGKQERVTSRSRTPSPPRREAKELVTLRESSKIMAVKVEAVGATSEERAGANNRFEIEQTDSVPDLPPKRPPKREVSRGSSSSEGSTPTASGHHPHSPSLPPKHSTLPGHQRLTSGHDVPPSLPPRPVSLHRPKGKSKHAPPPPQDPSMQYAVMNFSATPTPPDNYTYVTTVPVAPKSARGGSGKSKVPSEQSTIYMSIDHQLTTQLGKFKEDVEEERKKQREQLVSKRKS